MSKKPEKLLSGILLLLIVLFTNQFIPVCFLAGLFGPRGCEVSLALVQMVVFSLITLIVIWIVRYKHQGIALQNIWRKNWFLVAFICLALLSNLWSVVTSITILRSILLLLLAIIASYFGLLFSARNLLNYIAVSIGVLALASLILGIFLPKLAIMSNHPYEGLWRGVFWHKVYLGAVMALGYAAYLTILLAPVHSYTPVQKSLAGLMLIICSTLAILSNSASGLVVFVIQTCLVALIFLWLLWGHLIGRRAYFILGAISVTAIMLAAFNLDFIFGLFNRSANMTGRVPLWSHLLKTYIADRRLFGYGIGTFWYQPGVSAKIQSIVGWGYPIGVSDNGYMDILLGLGASGLIVLISILLIGIWRTFRNAYQNRELVSFFPFLLMIHIVFINISLSYFLESESFIWFLLVLVVFMFTERDSKPQNLITTPH